MKFVEAFLSSYFKIINWLKFLLLCVYSVIDKPRMLKLFLDFFATNNSQWQSVTEFSKNFIQRTAENRSVSTIIPEIFLALILSTMAAFTHRMFIKTVTFLFFNFSCAD